MNPITEQLVTFPTSVQNVIWTATPHEGRNIDESITFSSSEGVNVNADVSLSFHIEPNLAPHFGADHGRLGDCGEPIRPAALGLAR